MQIKTTKLQDLLSRAIKGVGNNKNIPFTSCIAIELKANVLTICTSDASTYLYLMSDVEGEDFYVCVQAEQFSKLIARMTSEDITLNLTTKGLEIKGNGTYTIPFVLEDGGDMVRFPDRVSTSAEDEKELGELTLSTVKTILNSVRPALSENVGAPQYANYFVGTDNVIATDMNKMSALSVAALSTSLLVKPNMLDLLDVVTDGPIKVVYSESTGHLKFTTENCAVCGEAAPGIEEFNIAAINSYLTERVYKSMCKLSKVSLLQVIDRISLFVESYDSNIVTIDFTESGLFLSNKQSSGTEVLPYTEVKDFEPCTHTINIEYLRAQVKAQTGDTVEIWFGDDKSIKFIDNDLTFVVSYEE